MLRGIHVGFCIVIMSLIVFLTGCQENNLPTVEVPPPTKTELVGELENVIEVGQGGSYISGVEDGVAALKETDPELFSKLSPKLTELQKASESQAIKDIANEMLEILK